ncbi:MAG: hypothetical protein QG623_691 [Patescibacteria group bacterium]|nr:hypothetical protein [Patescibacteria group bacterium]
MSLRHGFIRTAVAVPMGTLAYGEAKEPGHIARIAMDVGDLGPYGQVVENTGEFLSQHHNPTVAFFGLSAIAIAVNRGPLFAMPSIIRNRFPKTNANTKSKFVGKPPKAQVAHRLSNVAMKSAKPKARNLGESDNSEHITGLDCVDNSTAAMAHSHDEEVAGPSSRRILNAIIAFGRIDDPRPAPENPDLP